MEKLYTLVTRSSPKNARVRHLFVNEVSNVCALKVLILDVSSTLETLVWKMNRNLDFSVLHTLITSQMPVLRSLTVMFTNCWLYGEQPEAEPAPHAPALPRLTKVWLRTTLFDTVAKLAGDLFNEAPLVQHVFIPEMPTTSAVTRQPLITGQSVESLYTNKPWATPWLVVYAESLLFAGYAERWKTLLPVHTNIRCVMEAVGALEFVPRSETDGSTACADLGLTYRPHDRSPQEWKDEWMNEVELLAWELLTS